MAHYCPHTGTWIADCDCEACEDMRAEDTAAERQHDARKEGY